MRAILILFKTLKEAIAKTILAAYILYYGKRVYWNDSLRISFGWLANLILPRQFWLKIGNWKTIFN